MKVVKINSEIHADNGLVLKAGHKYVMSDSFVKILMNYFEENFIDAVYDFDIFYKKFDARTHTADSLDGKKLLIWRTGGIGDILFTTPAIRYLKAQYPTLEITFACRPIYAHVIRCNPNIDKIINLPIDFEEIERADYHLIFEGLIENNKMASKINAYDLFIENFGLLEKISDEDKIPDCFYSDESKSFVEDWLNKKDLNTEDKIKIGIHYKSSTIVRTYPLNYYAEMMSLLNKIFPNINFIMLGSKRDSISLENFFKDDKYIYDFSKDVRNLEDSIAIIDSLDGFIGADSGLLHIAAACRKPIVGLYGPFCSPVRAKYYKDVLAFDVDLPCSPCFLHSQFPCNNSLKNGYSACMSFLRPMKILPYIKIFFESFFKERLYRQSL